MHPYKYLYPFTGYNGSWGDSPYVHRNCLRIFMGIHPKSLHQHQRYNFPLVSLPQPKWSCCILSPMSSLLLNTGPHIRAGPVRPGNGCSCKLARQVKKWRVALREICSQIPNPTQTPGCAGRDWELHCEMGWKAVLCLWTSPAFRSG